MEAHAFRQLQALSLRLATTGLNVDSEAVRATVEAKPRQQKSIAVLPIHGALEARPSFLGALFGMPSYERIGQVFDMLLRDESVSHIVLDIASPGGQVYGCSELANQIYAARGKKPILAMCNPMAASGAYWLAAAADRVIAMPSADVGSVGVIGEHIDMSRAMDSEGVKVTVIRSTQSPYKQETNDAEPLSDEAKANMQSRVDVIYSNFVSDLAKFRGVSVDYINERFGKGRVVDARSAMSAKMIDNIYTTSELLQKLSENRLRLGGVAAEDNWNVPTVRECRAARIGAITAPVTIESVD